MHLVLERYVSRVSISSHPYDHHMTMMLIFYDSDILWSLTLQIEFKSRPNAFGPFNSRKRVVFGFDFCSPKNNHDVLHRCPFPIGCLINRRPRGIWYIHKVFFVHSHGDGAPLFSNVSIVPRRARNLMSFSQEPDSAWQPFTRWYGLLVFGLLRSLLKEEVTAVPWDDLVLFFRWMSMAQLCPLNMVLYHDVPVCYVELAWISMN